MSEMIVKVVLLLSIIFTYYGEIDADLPSCERARCHHCRVTFIAKMCPDTCAPCPKDKNLLTGSQGREHLLKKNVKQRTEEPRQSQNQISLQTVTFHQPFLNNSYNHLKQLEKAQARAVNTQNFIPRQQQQNPIVVQYNSMYPRSTQVLPDSYHYRYLPQSSQQHTQYPPSASQIHAVPQAQSSSVQEQQNALAINNPFPTLPPFLTFTLPTFPAFTFPTVTFSPSLYQSAGARLLPNQPAAQIPPPPSQQSPQTQVATPEHTLAVVGSQAQSYLQQQPAIRYAVEQQQAVPIYPVLRQPQLYNQQIQSQAQPQPQPQISYLQIQQPQPQIQQQQQQQFSSFYSSNQQAAARERQLSLPQIQQRQQQIGAPRSASRPQAPVAYSIDLPNNFIDKTYYETSQKRPTSSAQCPRLPNWDPCITKDEANKRFKTCCQGLGQGCSVLCNYDATLTTIQLAVLTGRCPLNKVGSVMICASGYQDATACCEAYNVFERGYEHCRPYCNPAAGLPQGAMLSEQYKCLGKLSQIQQCFYVSQKP